MHKKIKELFKRVLANLIGRALWDAIRDHLDSL